MIADSKNQIDFFRPDSKPFGFTYGQWTVKWWQWAHGSPNETNPVLDHTGRYADVNQDGPVWFLAGTFGEGYVAQRACEIPFGKAILFPVINYEMNGLENPDIRTGYDLIEHVSLDIDDIVVKMALVDGEQAPIYRVQSDPPLFELSISSDNCMGIPGGGSTVAAADGYWVFLKSLSVGKHQIFFHGSCAEGTRNTAAVYNLTVKSS